MLTRSGGTTWFFITADYQFGYSLEANAERFIKKAGGSVLGSVRAPLGTADFSSALLQATHKWDVYAPISTLAGKDAFTPRAEPGCDLT